MRIVTVAILMLPLLWHMTAAADAAAADSCKQCRDQQKRCMANYPGPTCKTEYGICMKNCRSK